MKFIGKPGGVLVKGAPGNYEHGKIYHIPFRHSRFPYWELMEPVPEFTAPTPTAEDSVFTESYPSPDEPDGTVFVGATVTLSGEEDPFLEDVEVNIDPNTPATIEPYLKYNPNTDTLSELDLTPEPERDEETVEPDREALKKILDDAGIEYSKSARTTTLQKLVDDLAAKE